MASESDVEPSESNTLPRMTFHEAILNNIHRERLKSEMLLIFAIKRRVSSLHA